MSIEPMSASEFVEFADVARARRERSERLVGAALRAAVPHLPESLMEPVFDASYSLSESFRDLDTAVEELRVQSDELFAARVELDASAERFQSLFELAPVPYLVTDANACIGLANEAACSLLGRPKNALSRKPLACFVERAERAGFRSAVARSAAADTVSVWPIRLVPTGSSRAIDCRVHLRSVGHATDSRQRTLYWTITEDPGENLF